MNDFRKIFNIGLLPVCLNVFAISAIIYASILLSNEINNINKSQILMEDDIKTLTVVMDEIETELTKYNEYSIWPFGNKCSVGGTI